MEFVSQGAEGCVHRPPLTCQDNEKKWDYTNKISKLLTATSAKKELSEFDDMADIDPENVFTMQRPVQCKPIENESNLERIEKCPSNADVFFERSFFDRFRKKPKRTLRKDLALLLSDYGGEDLIRLEKTIVASIHFPEDGIQRWTKKETDAFWRSCIALFEGVASFVENGKIHLDVRPPNILYNRETKKAVFIDFGMMAAAGMWVRTEYDPPSHFQFTRPLDFYLYTRSSFRNRKVIYSYKENDYVMEHFFPKGGWVERLEKAAETFRENQSVSYDEFRLKSAQTFDLVGLCISLMMFTKTIQKCKVEGSIKTADLQEFFFKCLTSDVEARLSAEEALAEYAQIVKAKKPTRHKIKPKPAEGLWQRLKKITRRVGS